MPTTRNTLNAQVDSETVIGIVLLSDCAACRRRARIWYAQHLAQSLIKHCQCVILESEACIRPIVTRTPASSSCTADISASPSERQLWAGSCHAALGTKNRSIAAIWEAKRRKKFIEGHALHMPHVARPFEQLNQESSLEGRGDAKK
jgi:hypothetical protein